MELLTYKEIQEKYQMSYKAVQRRFARNNIVPVKKERLEENGKLYKRALFDADKVDQCLGGYKPKKQRSFWKLSVFDFNLGLFIVKKCSMTKVEANRLLKEREAAGDFARITPHVKKGA